MMDTNVQPDSPTITFLGMEGSFSLPPLIALIESGLLVQAVVVPALESNPNAGAIARLPEPRAIQAPIPVLQQGTGPTILQIAWHHSIPIWEIRHIDEPETLDILRQYHPDFICVACFPWRLPASILNLPKYGCLNIHPSLLPAYRGRDPIARALRDDAGESGVTIHLMDESLDTGDIILQQPFEIPPGSSYEQVEETAAELGGKMLVEAVQMMVAGTANRVRQKQ